MLFWTGEFHTEIKRNGYFIVESPNLKVQNEILQFAALILSQPM